MMETNRVYETPHSLLNSIRWKRSGNLRSNAYYNVCVTLH